VAQALGPRALSHRLVGRGDGPQEGADLQGQQREEEDEGHHAEQLE
jgi:hypothetical protein